MNEFYYIHIAPIICRIFGHSYSIVSMGFLCSRCGHFEEGSWNRIPPPPRIPESIAKRVEYEMLLNSARTYTDLGQSEMLLSVGLDCNTCDMALVGERIIVRDKDMVLFPKSSRDIKPVWSLGRLLALVPKIIIDDRTKADYLFTMSGDFISYSHFENQDHVSDLYFIQCRGDYVLGLVHVIKWLISSGNIETKYLDKDAEG